MLNAMKLIKIFSFITFILITLSVFFIYFLSNKSIPNYNNSYSLKEPFGSIRIIRDQYAIPHIFADDNRDIFFGLGFAHAQDRLWQMVLTRRFAYGRLSEVLGKQSNTLDDFMKRMDIKNLSINSLQFQSQRTQEALESYSNGVNSWLKQINAESLGRGSPEFFIHNQPITKWEAADSLSILRLNGLLGSSQIHTEILMLKAILKLKNSKVFDLFSQTEVDNAKINSTIIKNYEGISYFSNEAFDKRVTFNPILSPREIETVEMISVAPNKTIKAGSLLSHNVHSTLTAPSKFTLARLEFPTGSVIGMSIPGIPVILSGKNDNISWARGLVDADQIDMYIEQFLPEDRTKYRSSEKYELIKVRNDVIKTKGSADTRITLKWTKNGPIIPEHHFGFEIASKSNKAISIKSNAILERDLTMTASIDLMLANDVSEAIEVSKNHVTPIQNLMLVDEKNIAMQLIGKIPKRNSSHETRGLYPSNGWETKNQWDGFFLYEKNPNTINPSEGYIINTGNNFLTSDFPLNITFNWADTQKISRLRARISERDIFTTESLQDIQIDTVSYTARSLLGLIAEALWYEGSVAPKGSNKNTRQHILKALSEWNGDMKTRTFEPLLYEEWLKLLYQRIIQDELGSIHEEFVHFNPIFVERVFKNINNAKQWCDITQTNRIENCQELAKDSLNDTIFYLTEKYGKDINDWNSERLNKFVNYHNPFGANNFLKWLTNIIQNDTIGEFSLHGGKDLEAGKKKLNKTHASVFKGIYDMADENNNIYILSTGQSGHFLSDHYDDLSRIYSNEDYVPMTLNEDLIKVGAKGITRIN
jgi:penicillin amidase